MSSGTNKERLEQNNAKIEALAKIVAQKASDSNFDVAKGLADGTLTEFSAPNWGITQLAPQRFYNFTNLTKLDLTGITEIPSQTAYGCNNLTDLILDKNITDIGLRAFAANGLKNIDLKVNGTIGSYAFQGQKQVESFKFDKSSVITTLDNSAFQEVGTTGHSLDASETWELDFRNSTFTEIETSCFSGITNTRFYFSDKITDVSAAAFSSANQFKIYWNSLPNLYATSVFSANKTFKNFFPYQLVRQAKSKTNWSSSTNGIVSSIYGYADAGTFDINEELPVADRNGYALTWYSDEDLTQQVSVVSDKNTIYYCSVGAQAYSPLTIRTFQSNVRVVSEDGTTVYKNGDFVPNGTLLIITSNSDVDDVSRSVLTLNGSDISENYSYTADGTKISICCAYLDPSIEMSSTFANATPAQIKTAVDMGLHRIIWNVSDKVAVTLTDGTTNEFILMDTLENRYEKVDGSGYTNAVIGFNILPGGTYVMNSSNTAVGGWPASRMYTTTMPTMYNLLPEEWQAVVSEIKLKSVINTTQVVYSNDKVFLPAVQEVKKDYEGYSPDEGAVLFQNIRTSVKNSSGSVASVWLRSQTPSGSGFAYLYHSTGTSTSVSASAPNKYYNVAPIFAI